MSGSKLLAKNSVFNLIGQLIPFLCGFLAVPIIIKGMGVDRFAILSMSWIVLGYFNLFDLGLSRAATKYISESLGKNETHQITKIIWTTICVQIVLSLIGTVICTMSIPFIVNTIFKIPQVLKEETIKTFTILALSLPVVLISANLRGVVEAFQRFDMVNCVKIPLNALIFIIPAVLVKLSFSLPFIVFAIVIARILSAIAYFIFSTKLFPEILKKIQFELITLKLLAKYGAWSTISGITSPLFDSIERLFIPALLNIRMLGFYTAPYDVAARLPVFATSIAMALFPAFSHYSAAKKETLPELFLRPVKYVLIPMVPLTLFLYLFAGDILNLWIGYEFYANSTVVFRIFIVSFFINSIATIPFATVYGLGRADFKAKLDLSVLIVFIALIWFLTPRFGINGTAFARLAALTTDMVFLTLLSSRLIGLTKDSLIKFGVYKIAVLSASYIAFVLLLNTAVPKLALIVFMFFGALIYFYFAWLYAFDDKDRALIFGVLKIKSKQP